MERSTDNPGVYVPPPLIYAAFFLLSILIQKFLPLDNHYFKTLPAHIVGLALLVMALAFLLPALIRFLKTKNTLITIKPAASLQSTGIYSISRNPMYMGLAFIYAGLSILIGNWWTVLFIPFLIAVVTYFVIMPEERYLERAFGKTYTDYKEKARRWF